MTDEPVLITKEGAVRVITLNRPDVLNAFDAEMHVALPAALRQVANDRDARAIVLTGAGRAFSAGGDVDNFKKLADDFEYRRSSLREGRQLFEDLVNVPLPIVAAVNGPAVGLGCTVVTTCDVVHISEKAYLADPHVQVALVAGDGGAVTWPLSAGLLRAKAYLLTGDRLPAARAVELGMATYVETPEELLPKAMATAQKLADLPPQAVQDTKSVLNQHLRQAIVGTLPFGLAAESQSHDTADYRTISEQLAKRNR